MNPRIAPTLLALMTVLLVALGGLPAAAQEQRTPGLTVLLEIEGAIGPATSEYVRDGFAEAQRLGAAAIVLRMDTPGGLDSAMREIIRSILDSSVPVITYVSPRGARAASAGTYILYASHLAAMAPSTHLGAATPVQIGGGGSTPPPGDRAREGEDKDRRRTPLGAMEAKVINDAVAYIRGLAELRGRNADWAERAVRDAETLTASQALKEKVVELVVPDLATLLNEANGRRIQMDDRERVLDIGAQNVRAVEPGWRTRILATITNPNVAYLLLLLGIYGLLFEFMSPGAMVPGVVGGISLLVGLYALNLMPVNLAGAALLAIGIALMIAEALVPSFGVLGVGGIVAFVLGSLLLFRGEVPGFQIAWPVVAAAAIASALLFAAAITAAWRAHRRTVVTGQRGLAASTARVLAWDNGEGEVLVKGEHWRARSATRQPVGSLVRIVGREGLTLVVEAAPKSESP